MKMIFLVIAFFTVLSCSNKTPFEIVADNPVLFPLTPGNSWYYSFQTLKTNGVPDTTIDTSNYLVEGKTLGDYYSVQYTTTFQTVVLNYYYKNIDTGLSIYNTTSNTEEFFLEFPSDSGNFHTWRLYKVETVSKDTTIVTDTGSFSCYHFHLSTGDSLANPQTQHIDYFFAPNFGMVMQLNRIFAHNEIQSGSIQKLIKYNLEN